jgi:hypothetical protein
MCYQYCCQRLITALQPPALRELSTRCPSNDRNNASTKRHQCKTVVSMKRWWTWKSYLCFFLQITSPSTPLSIVQKLLITLYNMIVIINISDVDIFLIIFMIMSTGWGYVSELRPPTGLMFILQVSTENHGGIISTGENSRFVHQSSLVIIPATVKW